MNTLTKCQICERTFNTVKSLGSHISQSHLISKEDYYNTYIMENKSECKLCKKPTRFINLVMGYTQCCSIKCSKIFSCQSVSYRNKISEATKKAMERPEVRTRFLEAVRKPKSEETRRKMSISGKQKFKNNPTLKNCIYTKKRNQLVAQKKTEYWKNNPEEKKRVGIIWKKWKERDEKGWREHLKRASIKGFQKIFSPTGDTSIETKLYEMLENANVSFIKKYELNYKIYDAYLPGYNLLIEIDGDFWHKNTLEECRYDFQKKSFYNDREKEKIARQNNIPLIRIKEHNIPINIIDFITHNTTKNTIA